MQAWHFSHPPIIRQTRKEERKKERKEKRKKDRKKDRKNERKEGKFVRQGGHKRLS